MQMSCGTVLDSTLKEGLATCKRLRENRTKWPYMYHRYHLTRGIDVTESDAIVVSARDKIQHTHYGCMRSSGGNVRYSFLDATRVRLNQIQIENVYSNYHEVLRFVRNRNVNLRTI